MTMLSPDEVALALQFGDSGFPAGGFALSWGLEGLIADGVISDADGLGQFVDGQLRNRWATFDRVVLHHVWGASIDELVTLDHDVEAATVAPAARRGSCRAGAAALATFEALGYGGVSEFRAEVTAGRSPGHQCVALAHSWQFVGLALDAAELVSAAGFVRTLTSAAVRLGLVGHLDAQRVLSAGRVLALDIVHTPVPAAPTSFTPLADIAMLRHPTRPIRLFAC